MNIKIYTEKIFEKIRHTDENGIEFWYARELMGALEYTEWRNFIKAIDKAKQSAKSTNISLLEHFVDLNKMVKIGSSSERKINDIKLKGDIQGEDTANNTHFNIGKKVRETMIEISGTKPEELSTPEKSIRKIQQERKLLEKSNKKNKIKI